MATKNKKAVKKSTPRTVATKKTGAKTPSKAAVSKKGLTPGKVILGALALGGVGVGGYFLWSHFKSPSTVTDNASADMPTSTSGTNTAPTKSPSATSSWKSGVFPIVQGMKKNNDVYALQLAMLKIGGAAAAAIQNSGGADGSYGPGLAKALAAAGFPTTIVNQAKLSEIIGSVSISTGASVPTSKFQTGNYSSDIRSAEATKNVDNVVAALSQLQSVADYVKANNNGDGIIFGGDFLHRTIVTKLLDTFGNSDRSKIEAEFIRIGLKKNPSGSWSLQGFSGFGSIENAPQIVMMQAAYVSPKGQPNVKVVVPPNFIVGKELSRSGDFIEVMTIDNKIVIVPAEATKAF